MCSWVRWIRSIRKVGIRVDPYHGASKVVIPVNPYHISYIYSDILLKLLYIVLNVLNLVHSNNIQHISLKPLRITSNEEAKTTPVLEALASSSNISNNSLKPLRTAATNGPCV